MRLAIAALPLLGFENGDQFARWFSSILSFGADEPGHVKFSKADFFQAVLLRDSLIQLAACKYVMVGDKNHGASFGALGRGDGQLLLHFMPKPRFV